MLALKKLLTLACMPLGLAMLLVPLAVLALVWRRQRLAMASLSLSLAVLYLFSTPTIANAIGRQLEARYPAIPIQVIVNRNPEVEAIVVMGGGIEAVVQQDNYRPWPDLNDASDRVWHASKLYYAYRDQHNKRLPVVLSGGMLPWVPGDTSEANAMAQFAGDLGVPAERMIEESSSLTTEENARFTAALLQQRNIKRIALVTSGTHMPRAVAQFERAGFEVVAVSTDQRFPPQKDHWLTWLPRADALDKSTIALKEWLWLGADALGLNL